ncbi:MAG: cytochrome bc complex cytochrome b subunit [Deltaproteobacteria bacterium]|nr:cytochrome bc complex cytochrome b subunit [Deltaproteobacteria bacterium]
MNCPRLRDWLEERYDLAGIKGIARGKFVPEHRHDIWYYTGGITLFLFLLQFLTGMLMAFYYVPHVDFAYKSIIEIVTKLRMGWFFKSLHHWGAQLAILFLFVHLFGTLLMKSYRKPRELAWVTGFILLGISIFFGLSGYLLLWDERAFAAVRVATGGAGAFPVVGGFIKAFLRGSVDVTGETLLRFYAFHVAILPLVTLALIGLHLLLVQFHGMSVPPSMEKEKLREVPFFPNVFYKDLMIWLVVLGVVVTLAVFFPPEIGVKADPLAPPPENIKPEWYFLFLLQTLKLFPGSILGMNGETIAILTVSGAILFFFLIPFLDRKSSRGERSPLFTWIGILYLIYFLVMTAVGFLS